MLQSFSSRVLFRQIEASDFDEIAELLARGFPNRTKRHFLYSLKAIENHRVPRGFPQIGLMMESEGRAVGVLLLIYSEISAGERSFVRCNASSWYVEPPFRFLAPSLVSLAMKKYPATYINTSPLPHTWPIIEAQGFRRFTSGSFIAVPALVPKFGGATITPFRDPGLFIEKLPQWELRLLADHHKYGCITLVCEMASGAHAFVFKRRWIKRRLPGAQLIYCSSEEALIQAAGSVGRYLLMRGIPFLLIASAGSLPLPGWNFDNIRPMYYHGQERPQPIGDLAYTELALLLDL